MFPIPEEGDDEPFLEPPYPKIGIGKGMVVIKFGPKEHVFKKDRKNIEVVEGFIRGNFKWFTLKKSYLHSLLKRKCDDYCQAKLDTCIIFLERSEEVPVIETPEFKRGFQMKWEETFPEQKVQVIKSSSQSQVGQAAQEHMEREELNKICLGELTVLQSAISTETDQKKKGLLEWVYQARS